MCAGGMVLSRPAGRLKTADMMECESGDW